MSVVTIESTLKGKAARGRLGNGRRFG